MTSRSVLSFVIVLLKIFYYCIESVVHCCTEAVYKRKNSLTGKSVLVTGSARGIGYAIAEELFKQGVAKVVLCDINKVRVYIT